MFSTGIYKKPEEKSEQQLEAQDKIFEELREAIESHDHKKFKELYSQFSQFKCWQEIENRGADVELTYGHWALKKAVYFSNEEAFSRLMYLDSQHNHFITKGQCASEIFLHAIKYATPSMVDQLIKHNPALLNTRYYNNENLLATAIRNVGIKTLLRNGKFQKIELSPTEENTVEFFGALDTVNLLISHKADFWTADKDGITPYEVITNPDDPKYQEWFCFSGMGFKKNRAFFQHNGETQLSLRTTGTMGELFLNGKLEDEIPIKIEFHFSKLRTILERAKMNATFENGLANEKVQKLEQEIKGLNGKISNEIHEKYSQATLQLENRFQKVEMDAYQLQADTFSVVQKTKEKSYWQDKKKMIDTQPLTKFFCDRVDNRLRNCVNALELLSSGKIQRQKGMEEDILSETLGMIGDQLGMFGGIIFKIAKKGVEFGADKYYERLYERVAKLFPFTNVRTVCDKVAIAVSDMCAPFILQPLTKEGEVKSQADHAVAFLLYLMSREDIIKPNSPENPIERQLIDNFARSQFLTGYGKECEQKEQKFLELEHKAFEKQQKKEEGKSSFGLLSKFKAPWKKSSSVASPSLVETKKTNDTPVYYGNIHPVLPNGNTPQLTFSYDQWRQTIAINPYYPTPSAPPLEETMAMQTRKPIVTYN